MFHSLMQKHTVMQLYPNPSFGDTRQIRITLSRDISGDVLFSAWANSLGARGEDVMPARQSWNMRNEGSWESGVAPGRARLPSPGLLFSGWSGCCL